MTTAKRSDLPEGLSCMRSSDLSVVCSTETNSPGPLAPFNGAVSSRPGDVLVAGSLLILLFAGALLIPFERLIPQERDGKKSSRSTTIASQRKKKSGGTERGQYEEK